MNTSQDHPVTRQDQIRDKGNNKICEEYLVPQPLKSEGSNQKKKFPSSTKIAPPIRPRVRVPQNSTKFKKEGISSTTKTINLTKQIKASDDKLLGNHGDPDSSSEYLMPEISVQNITEQKFETEKSPQDKPIKVIVNPSTLPKFKSVNTTQNNAELKSRKKCTKCLPNKGVYNMLNFGKPKNVISLSPRIQSLHKFFEEKRTTANAWKAKILSENRKRSQRDLQWAARQLRTFSTNNYRSNSPVKGHFMRIISDITSGDSYDPGFDPSGFHAYQLPTGDKVTPEAQEILLVLRDTVALIINDIITIEQELSKKNFNPCFSVVEHLEMLPNMLIALIDHLQYTPSEFELVSVAKNVNNLIEDVLKDPVIILFRMIELGHYLYCLGRILGEKIMPRDLPRLLHSIQVKLQVCK